MLTRALSPKSRHAERLGLYAVSQCLRSRMYDTYGAYRPIARIGASQREGTFKARRKRRAELYTRCHKPNGCEAKKNASSLWCSVSPASVSGKVDNL